MPLTAMLEVDYNGGDLTASASFGSAMAWRKRGEKKGKQGAGARGGRSRWARGGALLVEEGRAEGARARSCALHGGMATATLRHGYMGEKPKLQKTPRKPFYHHGLVLFSF